MNLRTGQTDAVILVHRFDHIVDEFLHEWIPKIGFLDRTRARAQHGMSHARYLEDGHRSKL